LLAEHELLKSEWQEGEELLSRVITRLMAADGLDETIDPYLQQIRDLLRHGAQTEALGTELDGISGALFRAALGRCAADPKEGVDGLCRFFNAFAASEQERIVLDALWERAERGGFDGEPALFSALERQLEHMAGERPGFFSRLFSGSVEGKSDGKIDLCPVHKKLVALLEAVDLPLACRWPQGRRQGTGDHRPGTGLLDTRDGCRGGLRRGGVRDDPVRGRPGGGAEGGRGDTG
jgi:hypothetical protein